VCRAARGALQADRAGQKVAETVARRQAGDVLAVPNPLDLIARRWEGAEGGLGGGGLEVMHCRRCVASTTVGLQLVCDEKDTSYKASKAETLKLMHCHMVRCIGAVINDVQLQPGGISHLPAILTPPLHTRHTPITHHTPVYIRDPARVAALEATCLRCLLAVVGLCQQQRLLPAHLEQVVGVMLDNLAAAGAGGGGAPGGEGGRTSRHSRASSGGWGRLGGAELGGQVCVVGIHGWTGDKGVLVWILVQVWVGSIVCHTWAGVALMLGAGAHCNNTRDGDAPRAHPGQNPTPAGMCPLLYSCLTQARGPASPAPPPPAARPALPQLSQPTACLAVPLPLPLPPL
jgi:hypothetical protein